MPWMIVEEDKKFCVHKQNSDKTAGEKLKCYDTKAEARDYMAALYKNAMQAHFVSADESITQRINRIQESFYVEYNKDNESNCWIKDIFEGFIIVDEMGDLFQVSYTDDGETVTFQERPDWVPVKQEYVTSLSIAAKRSNRNYRTFVLFSQIPDDFEQVKAIDGIAAGTFISMSGEEVTFDPKDFPTYVENTRAVIASTKTESGQIVGLPIDKEGHDYLGGAGWLIDVELDEAREIIRFIIRWTQDGVDLIKKDIRRFFSASVDSVAKVILGGSLTNWPAMRDDQWNLLLRPIEMSQPTPIKEIDMAKTMQEMFDDLKASVLERLPHAPEPETPANAGQSTVDLVGDKEDRDNRHLKELLNTPTEVDELGEKAQEMAQEFIRAEKRKMHHVAFAASVCGGTKEKPFGLPVPPAQVVALLCSLPEKQALAVEKILSKSLDRAIDFAQHGIDSDGFVQRAPLAQPFLGYARTWVKSGRDIASFFEVNPEIGKMEDFNLSEFAKKE